VYIVSVDEFAAVVANVIILNAAVTDVYIPYIDVSVRKIPVAAVTPVIMVIGAAFTNIKITVVDAYSVVLRYYVAAIFAIHIPIVKAILTN
jgi:hypothetical protein